MDHMSQGSRLVGNAVNSRKGHDPLPRLLVQLIERAGAPAIVEHASSRPWASALFEGRRHVITLRLTGVDANARRMRFAEGLADVEWRLTGHFVADICVDEVRSGDDGEWIELSALTIEDW